MTGAGLDRGKRLIHHREGTVIRQMRRCGIQRGTRPPQHQFKQRQMAQGAIDKKINHSLYPIGNMLFQRQRLAAFSVTRPQKMPPITSASNTCGTAITKKKSNPMTKIAESASNGPS